MDSQGGGNLAAAVEDLDGGRVDGRSVGRGADLGHVGAGGEHAEGLAEGEVADDVEGEVVEPLEAVQVGGLVGALGVLDQVVPLLDEELEVGVHVGLELQDRLGGKGVRDDLALAGVLGAVAGVEETTANAHEGIVEVTAGFVSRGRLMVLTASKWNTYDLRKPFPWP